MSNNLCDTCFRVYSECMNKHENLQTNKGGIMFNSWEELVPRKKEVPSLQNLLDDHNRGYNAAIDDFQPLVSYVEKLERALDEIIDADGDVGEHIDIARKARTEER